MLINGYCKQNFISLLFMPFGNIFGFYKQVLVDMHLTNGVTSKEDVFFACLCWFISITVKG